MEQGAGGHPGFTARPILLQGMGVQAMAVTGRLRRPLMACMKARSNPIGLA